MLKLPTRAELVGLFFAPTKVEHAIKGIESAINATQSVGHHNRRRALKATTDADFLRKMADDRYDAAADHASEALRADRVAGKLRALVA